jgi:hypothetical protein
MHIISIQIWKRMLSDPNKLRIPNCKRLFGEKVFFSKSKTDREDMKYHESFSDSKLDHGNFDGTLKDCKKLIADADAVLGHYTQKYLQ